MGTEDYILRKDALAFQDEIEPSFCFDNKTRNIFSATKDADLVAYLNAIPAADVVEVVRCSVCKKVVLEDRGNGKSAYWCPVNRNYRCWDEFCNRGERRAE